MTATTTLSRPADPRVLAARVCELFAAACTFQTWALTWAADLAFNAKALDVRLFAVEAMAASGAAAADLTAACTAFRLAYAAEAGWDLDEYRRMIGAVDAPAPAAVTEEDALELGCWGDRLDAARVSASSKAKARRFARTCGRSAFTAYRVALAA